MVRFAAMRVKIRFISLAATLAISLSGFSIWAAETRVAIDVAALGPQIGERVPDFALPDQAGQIQTLDSIRGRNGTMLLFHRSADW